MKNQQCRSRIAQHIRQGQSISGESVDVLSWLIKQYWGAKRIIVIVSVVVTDLQRYFTITIQKTLYEQIALQQKICQMEPVYISLYIHRLKIHSNLMKYLGRHWRIIDLLSWCDIRSSCSWEANGEDLDRQVVSQK